MTSRRPRKARQRTGVGFSFGAAKDAPLRDLVVRFGFGFVVSAVAGVIAMTLGARAGGIMLGFPAILPATLTLIEKKQSEQDAEHDDIGAILGAAALIVFAIVGWQLFPRIAAAGALAAAAAAWLVAALVLYAALSPTLRRFDRNLPK